MLYKIIIFVILCIIILLLIWKYTHTSSIQSAVIKYPIIEKTSDMLGTQYYVKLPIDNQKYDVLLDSGSFNFIVNNLNTKNKLLVNKNKFVKYSPNITETLTSDQCINFSEHPTTLTPIQNDAYHACAVINEYTTDIFGFETIIGNIVYGGVTPILGLAQQIQNGVNDSGTFDFYGNKLQNITIDFKNMIFTINDPDTKSFKYINRIPFPMTPDIIGPYLYECEIQSITITDDNKQETSVIKNSYTVIFDTGTSTSIIPYSLILPSKNSKIEIKFNNNVTMLLDNDNNNMMSNQIVIGNKYFKNKKLLLSNKFIGIQNM